MRPGIWTSNLALASLLGIVLAQPPPGLSDSRKHYDDRVVYDGGLEAMEMDQNPLSQMCPDYTSYARMRHKPFSEGPLQMPYQRPHLKCRRFSSPSVEKVIEDLYPQMKDLDLAHIFQNAFPNTLDTTVQWHVDGEHKKAPKTKYHRDKDKWKGAQSFIVTGDINAEWLRDSTNQLAQYQLLAKSAPDISNLLLGAINTQAEFVIDSPYCNAFQPPTPSGLEPSFNGQEDYVHPAYEPSIVFECKYELDSLANFLSLSNQYYNSTHNTAFLTSRWFMALETMLKVLDTQTEPTFNPTTHTYERNEYTFSRFTQVGTETLALAGVGNPLANGTGLIRSAFRPSDDATIFGFLIPSNAMLSVELERASGMLHALSSSSQSTLPIKITSSHLSTLSDNLLHRARTIRAGIYAHAIISHPIYGDVFAYEIDGYGSHLLIDDANVPSLLSLPLLGFLSPTDPIYLNTRRMILSSSNPYYLTGTKFTGIGGPHIGLRNAWPMSVLVQAMTSTNETEIMDCLERVKRVSVLGLINESVDVDRGVRNGGDGMTRSWFAWANSVFAQCVLWLAVEKPHLVLKDAGQGRRYVVGEGFVDL